MAMTVPRAVAHRVPSRRRGRLVRGLVWLAHLAGFLVEVVDELVTARLGVPPLLPRWRRWRQHVVAEWRVYRAVADGDVIEAEFVESDVVEGVWR